MKVLIGFIVGYLVCYVQFYETKLSGFWALGLVIAGIVIRRFAGRVLDPVADEVLREESSFWARLKRFWSHHRNKHSEFNHQLCSTCRPMLSIPS